MGPRRIRRARGRNARDRFSVLRSLRGSLVSAGGHPMRLEDVIGPGYLDRRSWFRVTAAGLAGLSAGVARPGAAGQQTPADPGKKTRFQVACMTLPYSRFPLQRALTGLQSAGYRYVAWGTTHVEENGERVPVLAN